MVLKVWNEDLLRGFIARQRQCESQEKELQHTYKKAIVVLRGQRADIKQQRNGHIINLPDFGAQTLTQLAQRIISEAEPVITAELIPFDPDPNGTGLQNADEIVSNMQKDHVEYFVRQKLKFRQGSYAILMTMHEFLLRPTGRAKGYLEEPDFASNGSKWMDGPFMPNFHAGALKGIGWDSRETLKTHRFITVDRVGAGQKYQYRLTEQGKQVINEIICFFHNGTDPVTSQPVSHRPAEGVQDIAAGHVISLGSTWLASTPLEHELEDFVRSSLVQRDFPAEKSFSGTKDDRRSLHQLLDSSAFKAKYRAWIEHESAGQGRQRTLVVIVRGGPRVVDSTVVASSSSAVTEPLHALHRGGMRDDGFDEEEIERALSASQALAPALDEDDLELRRAIDESLRTVPRDAGGVGGIEYVDEAKQSAPGRPPEMCLQVQGQQKAKRKPSQAQLGREKGAQAAEKRMRLSGMCGSSTAGSPNGFASGGGSLVAARAQPDGTGVSACSGFTEHVASLGSTDAQAEPDMAEACDDAIRPPASISVPSRRWRVGLLTPPPVVDTQLQVANCKPLALIVDERERVTDSVPRALRNSIKTEIRRVAAALGGAPISVAIATIPVSDFVWRREDTGEILGVMVERKAIKDLVGRSAADDQTRQLERMVFLNDQSNVLLIDGDPQHAKNVAAYGNSGRASCWDPERRYFNRGSNEGGGADSGEGTAIVDFEHLLVYTACLLTNGQISVAFTGDQRLESVLSAFSLALSDTSGRIVKALFVNNDDFKEQSDDVRHKQNQDLAGYNIRDKRRRKNAHKNANEGDLRTFSAGLTDVGEVRLRFACSESFWEHYKEGRKEYLKSFTIHGSEDRITRFGQNQRDVTKEGRAYLDLNQTRTLISPTFEALPGDDELLVMQCFSSTTASAQVQATWWRGRQLLEFVHTFASKHCINACADSIVSCMRLAAEKFALQAFASTLSAVHQRRLLFVTNLNHGRGEYARTTMVQKRLPVNVDADQLLGVLFAILTIAHKVTVLHFSKLGPAYVSSIVQYLGLELAKSVASRQAYFETDGM